MISQSDYYNDLNGSVLAKFKRLKIQENVMYSNINKSLLTLGEERENLIGNQALDNFKLYESSLCDLFTEIKNLFEDIKINTDPHNNIELDIDEVKRDIFLLESKLKTFKNHIQTELRLLILREKDINNQLSTNAAVHSMVNYKASNASAKAFTDIVPSPVKMIINCPFKCPEVQTLQEFLKNSSNRYNGWNEYHHNVFVRIWNKHFSADDTEELLNQEDCEQHIERLHRFQEEVMEKISGVTLEDIKSNYRWYTQYMYLKTRQQKALEKWKENKQKMKKHDKKGKQKLQSCSSNSSANSSNIKVLSKASKDKLQHRDNPLLNSQTLQERYKKSIANFNKQNSNDAKGALHLAGIMKDQWKPPSLLSVTERKRQLRIPPWRMGLH